MFVPHITSLWEVKFQFIILQLLYSIYNYFQFHLYIIIFIYFHNFPYEEIFKNNARRFLIVFLHSSFNLEYVKFWQIDRFLDISELIVHVSEDQIIPILANGSVLHQRCTLNAHERKENDTVDELWFLFFLQQRRI